MIRLSLVGVRVEVPTNQPIVLLREDEGQRYLPIFIGPPEATAIVYALQGMETPRPMTHDLFKTVLDDMSMRLQQVVITELHDGTFYAEIELAGNGNAHRISSRPSDAIALAVRCEAQIFAADDVVDESAIEFQAGDDEQASLVTASNLADLDPEEFRRFIETVTPEEFASSLDEVFEDAEDDLLEDEEN